MTNYLNVMILGRLIELNLNSVLRHSLISFYDLLNLLLGQHIKNG